MKIKTIEEYISKVNDTIEKWGLSFSTTHTWFRGQGNSKWKLTPKILRSDNVDFTLEREYHRDFKLYARNFVDSEPKDDFEWMFLMQHYGMPTRLLDWTESHLMALFFAVENYSDNSDAAVWIIDPWSLNEATMGDFSVPVHSHEFLKDYILPCPTEVKREVDGFYPVCLRAPKSSSRILAQKGNFSIHGNIMLGIDELAATFNKKSSQIEKVRLRKLIIDGKSKLKILKQLAISGITYSVIYPDLEGLSKEIELRYSYDYLNNKINGRA